MTDRVTLRAAAPSDAEALHALISSNLEEGHLLPRRLDELTVHASRFIVAVAAAGSSAAASWRRSAAISPKCDRSRSTPAPGDSASARQLVAELRLRARRAGYERLCVLTHAPDYFINFGFSIVPHLWVQEKVFTDCVNCPKFRTCGQFAMVVPLETSDASDRDEAAAVLHCA